MAANQATANKSAVKALSVREIVTNYQKFAGRRIRVSGNICRSGGGGVCIYDVDAPKFSLQLSLLNGRRLSSYGVLVIEGKFVTRCFRQPRCTDLFSDFDEIKLISFDPKDR
ncbi:MAG: hypothetical protein ACKVOJ_03430 [Sphingomonadaceae bacterium]